MFNFHFGRLTGPTIQNQEKGHAKGLRLFFNVYKGKTKTPSRFENTLQLMGKASKRQHKIQKWFSFVILYLVVP